MRWSFLERAVTLGFDEIELHGNGRPAVCRSGKTGRTYVWMTLHDEVVDPVLPDRQPAAESAAA